MNKKVLTLCASFLLAGGLTSSVLAQQFGNVTQAQLDNGQYFYVNVSKSTITNAASATQLDVNGTEQNPDALNSKEENRSTWFRMEVVKKTVNGTETIIGYKLINALTGKALTVQDENGKGAYDTFYIGASDKLAFVDADGQVIKYFNGSAAVSNASDVWHYLLEAVPVQDLSVEQVNMVQNGFFGLQFGYIDQTTKAYVNYESIEGVEALSGELVAYESVEAFTREGITAYNGSDINDDTTNDGSYFLYNKSADAYVVLLKEKWSKNNTDLLSGDGKGYKFALRTAKQIIEDQKLAADKQTIATWSFNVNMPVVKDYAPLEILARGVQYTPAAGGAAVTKDLELLIAEVNGVNYLTTNLSNDKLEAEEPTYTNVRFGMTDYADMSEFYGWAITIKGIEGAGVEGMTVRPDAENLTNIQDPEAVWTKADYVSFSRPEAQWIVTVEDASTYLTNRETKAKVRWNEAFNMIVGNTNLPNRFALRKESDNIYVYQKDANTAYRFEINKVFELGKDTWDDYGVYYQDDSEIGTGRTYKVTFTDFDGTTTYVGYNGVGDVLLTRDEAKAINFDLIRTQTTDTLNNDGSIAENAQLDYFQIYNNIMAKNKDGEWELKANGDTLSFYRYKLAIGDKFLNYNEDKKQFELVSEDIKYVDDDAADLRVNYGTSTLADNYVIKLKENDKLHIIKVLNYEMDDIEEGMYYANATQQKNIRVRNINGTEENLKAPADNWANAWNGQKLLIDGEKLFFDFNGAEVQKQENIYAWEPNAQLSIVWDKFNSYRYFATPDTMEFYRVEFDDEFLFERGKDGINFLGLTYDRKNYNPAIYVDTAYIQNTNKPTYLLAVAPEIEPSHKYCPTHGIDPDASVCVPEHQTTIPGYVTARYLVSFTDSVAAHAPELKNPYLEDGKYTKLGFVDAVHGVNDLNIIQNGDTVKTYELTDAVKKSSLNPVEFAFRIVDRTTEDFIIESTELKDGAYVTAYVRWQNGVPVLTQDITDAEVFNVRETALNPTANEEISAEASAISVIATDGAVIVKGAEGKNVIVSTILGKVVANETVNSDNETIAAPAGIVVVSVDGESFKVAVK